MCPRLLGPWQIFQIQTIYQRVSSLRSEVPSKTIEQVSPDSAATRKNLHQFLRGYYFELSISAVTRRFIHAPSSKLCRMSKPGALHMLISDLYHQLGAQRLPRQVLAMAPSTLASWYAMLSFVAFGFVLRQRHPGMIDQRVLTIRR